MSSFLFATLDAGGNLYPALGIGRELLRQGHRMPSVPPRAVEAAPIRPSSL